MMKVTEASSFAAINNNTLIGRKYFLPVEDPKLLIPILKERHPQSCFMYNQVVFSGKLKNSLRFYTLLSNVISSASWIVADYPREPNGHALSISAPISISKGGQEIPLEIRECFASNAGLIKWEDGAEFVGLEKPISAMILDIGANLRGNVVTVHPCMLYYVDVEDALKISLESRPSVEVRRLERDSGTDFIMSNWVYAREGYRTVISESIGAIASAGVFVDGGENKCASGVMILGDGMLHCLFTKKEYRNRGFAKLAMKYCFREFAKEGCYPSSGVEVNNRASIAFHESLGCRLACLVDYVDVKKADFE